MFLCEDCLNFLNTLALITLFSTIRYNSMKYKFTSYLKSLISSLIEHVFIKIN